MAGLNLYDDLRTQDPSKIRFPDPCVFISYRHRDKDKQRAVAVEKILRAERLDVYFDIHDPCLKNVPDDEDDVGVALCIESGLDRSTALLSVVSEETFDSAWTPYEIGGARGRSKFRFLPELVGELGLTKKNQTLLVAHDVECVDPDADVSFPSYLELGARIGTDDELRLWADKLRWFHSRWRRRFQL